MASVNGHSSARSAPLAKIIVIGRKSRKRISVTVQFVYQDDKLYLLPFMGKQTSWYRNLKSNPDLTISIGGTNLTGTAKLSTDEKPLKETLRKFVAKYGESNIDNYYPTKDAFVEVNLKNVPR